MSISPVLRPASILMCTMLGGCFYFLPLKPVYTEDCSGDELSMGMPLKQSDLDTCVYSRVLETDDVGYNTSVMALQAPGEVGASPDTFQMVQGSNSECFLPDQWRDSPWYHSSPVGQVMANYTSAGNSCTITCTSNDVDGVLEVNAEFQICDPDGEIAAGTAGAPPPSAVGQLYGRDSAGGPFPGQYWIQVLQREGSDVCVAVRRKPAGSPYTYSGVILGSESIAPSGLRSYSFVDEFFVPGLDGGQATVSFVSGGADVSATTGNSSLDGAIGLPSGPVLFTPEGPTSPGNLEGMEAHIMFDRCARLFERN